MYHIFLIQPSVNGHLGCFCVLAIVNILGGNIGVQVSFGIRFFFSGHVPVCCARVYVCMLSEKLNEITSVELQMEKREEE